MHEVILPGVKSVSYTERMWRTVNECLVRLTCDWRKSECHQIMSARCDVILKETIDGLAIFVTLCVSRLPSPWLSNLMRKINHLTESIYWSTLSEQNTWKCCMNFTLYFLNRSDGMAYEENYLFARLSWWQLFIVGLNMKRWLTFI